MGVYEIRCGKRRTRAACGHIKHAEGGSDRLCFLACLLALLTRGVGDGCARRRRTLALLPPPVFLSGGVVVTHLLVGRHVTQRSAAMRRPTKLLHTLARTDEAINYASRTNRGR